MDLRNSDSRRSSSSNSTTGVKSKWIKAFRSLKLTTVGGSSRNDTVERQSHSSARFNAQMGVHTFQEYTYKKITACDVCREILRGHSRQGYKCKLCKVNVHPGACQENAPRCQPKPRLLRKQKSASELETKIIPQIEGEKLQTCDPVYQSLRAAAEARKCAQYVSENYSTTSLQQQHDTNDHGSKSQLQVGSSNEGSSNNISTSSVNNGNNNYSGSGSGGNQNSGSNSGSMGSILAGNHDVPAIISSSRNSDEFHHHQHYDNSSYPLVQQTAAPPPVLRYNQQQQQQHYGPSGNNHDQVPHRLHYKQNSPALLTIAQVSHQAFSAPHSPQRKKLTLRMKSLSLDSPESAETLKDKRQAVAGAGAYPPPPLPSYPPSNTATVHTPPYDPVPIEMTHYKYKAPQTQSPGIPKRFKLGMQGRMCSFDDSIHDMSSSISPCPSPKPQRLLPTNIFVVLYNFRSRQIDELNLRAGYMVTVVDTTDPEWWQGKCLGKVGFFPSKYVSKLFPGERPLQVIHTVQVNDGEYATKLLREQIVIQVSDELNGIIMVRTGTNDKIVPCPSKYLQEINI